MSARKPPVRRWAPSTTRQATYEPYARRVLVWIGAGVGLLLLVVALAPLAATYNPCDNVDWSGHIRNSQITAETRPTCDNGTWTVTTPRGQMPEDGYGWNCYKDGNGVCGAKLEQYDNQCVTNPDDGYTMCQSGAVYYREVSGAKVWPVMRDPR